MIFARDLNSDSALARFMIASIVWEQGISPLAWLEVESKYGFIAQLFKAIVDAGTSFKVLRRLRKQTLLCLYG